MLLDLGVAEASAGLADWPEHLQRAMDTAPDAASIAEAAMVLAHAFIRAQRFAEAVDVLDRVSSSLEPLHAELALQLEAAAVFPGLNDPVTAPSTTLRLEALRERAASHPAAPVRPARRSRLLFCPDERARRGRRRPCDPGACGRKWRLRGFGQPAMVLVSAWFSLATFSLLWAERYAQVRPLLDASIAQARASGDGSRLAYGLANRGWLALRRGDLIAAEADTRTALAATELPAPPM